MGLSINTNIASLVAQNNLTKAQESSSTSMQRLSSGLRINNAADDAAGLAISSRMTATINGNNQAQRNTNDAINLVQTADSDLGAISNNLQRMRQLAVQGANDALSADDRTAIKTEMDALSSEIDRVAGASSFNGNQLIDGSGASMQFQIGSGTTANDSITVDFSAIDATASSLGVASSDLDVSDAAGAQDAIDSIDAALKTVNENRSTLGAAQNRFTNVVSALETSTQNLMASRGAIQDTNFASETASMTKNSVLQQAGVAMLAQANSAPNVVLKLLQG